MPEPIRFRRFQPLLKVKDLARSVAFYRDVLGFTPAGGWPCGEEASLVFLDHGPISLMLTSDPNGNHPGEPTLTGQFYLDCDVRALHELIKEQAKVLWGPEDYSSGRREFSIADPDGYRWVFGEATEEGEATVRASVEP